MGVRRGNASHRVVAMTAHVHSWLADPDRTRDRFSCTCGVQGHRAPMMPGQHRKAMNAVAAYVCQKKIDGRHCGAEATHVTGDRQASRCAEHTPAKSRAA